MDSPDDRKSPSNAAAFQFFDDGFSQSQSQRTGAAGGTVNGFAFQEYGNTQSQSQRVDMFTQGDLTQARSEFTQGDFTQPDDGGAGLEFCSQPENEPRRRHSSSSSSTVSNYCS